MQARGEERPPSPGKRRREPPSDLTLEDLPGISIDSATAQVGWPSLGTPFAGCANEHSVSVWCANNGLLPGNLSALLLQLGKKERTLQEATSPMALARTASDQVLLPCPPQDEMWSDGAATPRDTRGADEQHHWRERQQQQQRGRQRQASNLGPGGGAGPAAAPAAPAGGGGGKRPVPLLRLALPPQ